jgi:small subunit ribosomal protein S3Ae
VCVCRVDPFTRKEWYDIKVPALFAKRSPGKTPINKTAGQRIASEDIKGRVFEISLGDLNENSEEKAYAKLKFIVEEVQGRNVITNFYGVDFTRDKMASLLRKWQTMIECSTDVKTADGYTIRLFCTGFTARAANQQAKTTYATSSQVRAIRKKMVDTISNECSTTDVKNIMAKIVAGSIGTEIEKAAKAIFPLHNTFVHKIKIVKAPKPDLVRLMELHGEAGAVTEDAGKPVARSDAAAAAPELVEGSGGRL